MWCVQACQTSSSTFYLWLREGVWSSRSRWTKLRTLYGIAIVLKVRFQMGLILASLKSFGLS
ncbi:hypothetical protein MTR_7g057420 [Medicago truncatula]|uniref:Uncharacterized protein n=1 Tax=Medicago truncatula TaxID=3880 RepID=A0A072TZ66_MEDTR|nr:hypothetical protein MTR_7g057420 [Medicago truncatula]